MSSLIVKISKIDSIAPHSNADRLCIAFVRGWQCIVAKNAYKAGDLCIYIPIDSILPQEVEDKLFGPDSKIKLDKHRVRTIKIRGTISQGMIAPIDMFNLHSYSLDDDVAGVLNITKYEPPAAEIPSSMRGGLQSPKKKQNDNFKKYIDMENFKNFPDMFKEDDHISITEKLHGTSFRAGWVPTQATTLWKKIQKFLRLLPDWEFCYGSRNVQLQEKSYKGFYAKDLYTKTVEHYKLKDVLPKGIVVYGEVIGHGIQNGYTYGMNTPKEHKLFVYDVKENGGYVGYNRFKEFCNHHNLERVPELYCGVFSKEIAFSHVSGASTLTPEQKVREGIVIKQLNGCDPGEGRKVLKFLNDEYLLNKNNTDFH